MITYPSHPRAKRSQSARKSKAEGHRFEAAFSYRAKMQGIRLVQIPMGARMVGPTKMVRVKTPFDFVMAKTGMAAFVDTKSCGDGNFAKSQVTDHQVVELLMLEHQGFRAGYVVWFRQTDRVVFFSATQLSSLMRRESLLPDSGISLGSSARMDLLALVAPKASPSAQKSVEASEPTFPDPLLAPEVLGDSCV